jgi:ribonuclease E
VSSGDDTLSARPPNAAFFWSVHEDRNCSTPESTTEDTMSRHDDDNYDEVDYDDSEESSDDSDDSDYDEVDYDDSGDCDDDSEEVDYDDSDDSDDEDYAA